MKQILIITLFFWLLAFNAKATIHMPSVFSNNMVLQQNSEVTVWGWSDGGESISVQASWAEKIYQTSADNDGNWSVKINTPKAGGPWTLKISGSVTIVFENVLIGEVWLCTGQSNMEFSAKSGLLNEKEEVAAANYPKIRLFKAQRAQSDKPEKDCKGQWVECTPATMEQFSSIGYLFGRELQQNLNVPIGLIESTWGGTSIELWTAKEVIYNDSVAVQSARIATRWPIKNVSTMFNGMINPLIPYKIAGNIWYQGESNRYKTDAYSHLMELMIGDWRKKWGIDIPFYYVQIAPFGYKEPYTGALIREQQLKAMSIPNTGMAVTMDVGNPQDVHPKNKQVVAHRLALWALAKTYNVPNLVYCGPIFKEMEIQKSKAELSFDFAEKGLMVKGDELIGFELAGSDQVFYSAKATIKGTNVVVSCKEVKTPVAARYGFSNTIEPNLFNSDGLPASPFRTDNWPVDISITPIK